MTDIAASFDTLLRQASLAAKEYFTEAVVSIDAQFYPGYAEKHPELVAALIKAASADYNHAMLKLAAQDISAAISAIAEALDPG